MADSWASRLKKAWNVFRKKEENASHEYWDPGPSFYRRPDRHPLGYRNERTIINAILNRIALDCASIDIQHVKLDENGRYSETIDSGLNDCFNYEANVDQTGRAFRNDMYLTLLDKGTIAVVPVITDTDPESGKYDIYSMRVGTIVEWYPSRVKVKLYDERDGQNKEIILPKSEVAIIENPFYATMNDQNSTLQRLIRKLNLLDVIDEQSGSGKLDLIIQLPYVVKSEKQKGIANERLDKISAQLKDSQYGIAYIDATEKVTQLNRPVENNLLKQIEYLTDMLYGQLTVTKEILNGSASADVMQNYFSRTIEAIVSAVADECHRTFLTRDARKKGREAIKYFRDPFKLIPIEKAAEMADKFTRNEIMSSNEFRQVIGMKPSNDPSADELRNKNLSAPKGTGNNKISADLDSKISNLLEEKGKDQNG
jgi:hypothetical protein